MVRRTDDLVENDGLLNLREAINAANLYPDEQHIVLELPLGDGKIRLDLGQLLINNDVIIDAEGQDITIVADANARVMAVQASSDGSPVVATDVTLMGLGITGGGRQGAWTGGPPENGGGIVVDPGTSLTLVDTNVYADTAGRRGGGIFVADNAELVIEGGTVRDNHATNDGANARGGGIYARGTVTAEGATIEDNSADTRGSGMLVTGDAAVELRDVVVADNDAGFVGGLYGAEQAFVVLDRVDAVSTRADATEGMGGLGGGIAFFGGTGSSLQVADSFIARNDGGYEAGGLHVGRFTEAIMERSLIEDNRAVVGGGVFLAGRLAVADSTIAENVSFTNGGGIYMADIASLNLSNATITGNVAVLGEGGGLVNAGGEGRLLNAIVVGNTDEERRDPTAQGESKPGDISGAVTAITSLVGDDRVDGREVFAVPYRMYTDYGETWAGALAWNGGPTRTAAVRADGLAIDAGADVSAFGARTDQRGLPRLVDGDANGDTRIDVGALEFQGPMSLVGDVRYSATNDRADAVDLDGAGITHGDRLYAFLDDADPAIARVEYFVDGTLVQTEHSAPWDIKGGFYGPAAYGLDTSTLAAGAHVLKTVVSYPQANEYRASTTLTDRFTLVPYDVVYGAGADRAGPRELDGSLFDHGEKIYAFVDGPDDAISKVEFWLDGELIQIEHNAPWDVQGGFLGAAANGLDTTALEVGDHKLETIVTLNDVASAQGIALTDNFTVALDVPGDASTTAELGFSDPVHGRLSGEDDVDWFRVQLPAATTTIFQVDYCEKRSDDFIIINLFDEIGYSLAGGYDYIPAGIETDETASVFVSLKGPHRVGYLLRARQVEDQPGDMTTTARIEVGTEVQGRIDYYQDVDWFRIELVAGAAYVFEAQPTVDSESPVGRVWPTLFDADGQFVTGSYGSDGERVWSSHSPVSSGDFFLSVDTDPQSITHGDYTLAAHIATSLPEDAGALDQPPMTLAAEPIWADDALVA